MVGNVSLLTCHLSTSRPSLPRVSCTGYQAAACLQGRSFVAARLARSLFRRRGSPGHAQYEPRGRENGPAWRDLLCQGVFGSELAIV